MSADLKKSTGWMIVLILLGFIAMFAGAKWLIVLIPAAMMVWYRIRPTLRGGRN